MVFILNKLCVLLPYTYPTPKLSPHRRLCAFLDFQKKHHLVCFLSLLNYGDIGSVLIKTPSNCNTSVITHVIIQICVLINHINPHTTHTQHTHHTHTPHTHTHTTHTHTHTPHTPHTHSLLYFSTEDGSDSALCFENFHKEVLCSTFHSEVSKFERQD